MKKIKKIFLSNVVIALGVLLFTLPAMAATNASLSTTNLNVKPGQNFNVTVSVNPNGAKNYAEKVEVDFPADLLQVNSFTLGNTWMAMTQSGYDQVDNTNGVLIKTAGYPAGVSANTVFGTISFQAKKAGNAVIKIGNNSVAYEVNTQTALVGNSLKLIIVVPDLPQISTKTIVKNNVPTKTTNTKNQISDGVALTATAPVQVEIQPQTATVIDASDTKTKSNSTWLWITIIFVLIVVSGLGVYSYNKKIK